MPEVTGHTPGTASWPELTTPNVAMSKSFYRTVLGWDSYRLTIYSLSEYEIFTLGDVQGPEVAGAFDLVDEEHGSWACYFTTGDMNDTLQKIVAAGGQVAIEPTDVGDLGQMALCSDSQGAVFSLWLPYNLNGVGVVDEPGAMCWVELACPDVQEARRFYGQVFGRTAGDHYPPDYTDWRIAERAVTGMAPVEEPWPPGLPPFWIPYFWVSDCDATTARAVDAGAHVRVFPVDISPGRFSVLTDPTGAEVAVITPTNIA